MPDIRISTSFRGHRKRKKLSRLLEIPDATGLIVDLWLSACETRPQGILEDWDAEDIADAANYTGDPEAFVQALLKVKLLATDGNGNHKLHDWEHHQQWTIHREKRTVTARKGAAARWSKRWKQQKKVLVSCSKCDAEAPAELMALDQDGVCMYCRKEA